MFDLDETMFSRLSASSNTYHYALHALFLFCRIKKNPYSSAGVISSETTGTKTRYENMR